MKKNYWIIKTEPDVFSIKDLQSRPNQTSTWEGVRNYQARNYIKNEIKIGDICFFYHSSCPIPGIVGEVQVSKESYVDPTAFEKKSEYFDPKSTKENPRWFMFDVTFIEEYPQMITLNDLKNIPEISHIKILQKGNRLSITPISLMDYKLIKKMTT